MIEIEDFERAHHEGFPTLIIGNADRRQFALHGRIGVESDGIWSGPIRALHAALDRSAPLG